MDDQTITQKGSQALILDKAITHTEQDFFGYSHIARQLAQAIDGIGREGSAVIGIEGAWGSGKTSLLNLLRSELECSRDGRTFVLTVSPWLDGDGSSPVESLLLPVAKIIAGEEEKKLSPAQQRRLRRKKEMTETAATVFRYTKATARHLSPVAEFAALMPGIPNASGVLKALSEAGLEGKSKTTAELRAEIAEKIAALDLSFIVLLDDLDRLEPTQTVEIIRLIKSVADFPRFRYILCYDKAIVVQAIKTGLNVEDGGAYLQKIIQISFSLPRPESFDLRRQFLDGARELYKSVNDSLPNTDIAGDLHAVTDTFGALLKTPREVQLALNGVRFRYEGIRDYVYLPDLCFLQLLRVTHSAMYDWIEFYLTERAVVESGDGSISEEEQTTFQNNLLRLLAQVQSSSKNFIYKLRDLLPGITGSSLESLKLFQQTGDEYKALMTASRRLGSGAYWRYYFAFSSPQNVLPPHYFDALFRMAASEQTYPNLTKELLGRISSNGVSSRTWFEHILSQLTCPVTDKLSTAECTGLLTFFFNSGDEITVLYRQRNRWFSLSDLEVNTVANRLLRRMIRDNRDKALETLLLLATKGIAWIWAASFVRDLLWQNGMAGNRPVPEPERILTDEELNRVRDRVRDRLFNEDLKLSLLERGELGDFVWAWKEIAGSESLVSWIKQNSIDDKAFLMLMLNLRSHIVSSATGHYLTLNIKEIAHFFGGEEEITKRLTRIEKVGKFPDQIKEINDAITLNRSF
ncbi:phage T7 exclusion protein [Pectobacterium carotovorum subsp. carotovorum]|uniref:KAP family P-loop NTPase fold protein n=1 Tax=Pectobacterium carotovorum TaxID=554 RepID=UPI00207DE1A8|nr:KAP family NTPase [Pectobacterium carotovorum]GKV93185.1 phage T7 exclusion protein [Pectobacterium carotovorum subsp. carotovorum]